MSSKASRFGSILLLLIYLTAEVGFGMHRCNTDDTSYLFSAYANTECGSIHDHNEIDCNSEGRHKNICTCSQHTTVLPNSSETQILPVACCGNEFYSLEIDQQEVNVKHDINLMPIEFTLYYLANSDIYKGAIVSCNYIKHLSAPALNLRQILTSFSNWRL